MKKIILSALTCLSIAATTIAQTPINLQIKHKVNGQNPVLNTTYTDSYGEEIKITRLEYYVMNLTIIHDGYQNTSVPFDTMALINVENGNETTIELGNYNITNVEGIKFRIGVHPGINNLNPTQYPIGHPLGPQNPSMHWGWAAGYRFVAFEGNSGNNLSQMWQFHGLGNNNYFEIDSVMVPTEMVNGTETIVVEANYMEALHNQQLDQGLISHSESGPALEVLQNFKSRVFGEQTYLGIEEKEEEIAINAYPNPSIDGSFNLDLNDKIGSFKVVDLSGKVLVDKKNEGVEKTSFKLKEKGSYVLMITTKAGNIITEKLMHI